MAAPDTITISSNDFDVYELVATIDVYMLGRMDNETWVNADLADKERAAISATRLLELQTWKGAVTDTTTPQPLQWPRTGITDRQGVAVADSVIPQDILDAYYELANAFLVDPALADSANQDSNLKRAMADVVEVEFFSPVRGQPRFPAAINEILKPYLASEVGQTGKATGTDEESIFETGTEKFGLTDGLA